MRYIIWLVIAAAILAACLADNDTIHSLNQMTVGDVAKMLDIKLVSPLRPTPTPIYMIPRPTLER